MLVIVWLLPFHLQGMSLIDSIAFTLRWQGPDTKDAEVMVEEEAEVTAMAEEEGGSTATAMAVNEEAGGTAMVEEEAVATAMAMEVEEAGATVEGAGVIKNS